MRPQKSTGGIVIDVWENSNCFGSIGTQKCTKNAIFPQRGLLKPPLPHVGLIVFRLGPTVVDNHKKGFDAIDMNK